MSTHPLYGKKKKKLPPCPNPLFVQWLTEWRDAAAEKNAKSQYTYGKAINTLKKFPLVLNSGKECKILEYFGDKTCKMLDDRLAKHVAEYGIPAPVPVDIPEDTDSYPRPAVSSHHTTQPDATRGAYQAVVPEPNIRAVQNVHEISDSDEDQEPQQPARKRQRSGRRSTEREYIPAYRSGPYAIMLTLYKDMQSPNSRGFMTKTELCTQAQPMADKSFTIADPGCRYTAWSAMGTLIKKALVVKESSPAKYSLTDAGCALAHKLEAVKGNNPDSDNLQFRIHDNPPPVTAPDDQHVPPRLPSMDSDEDNGYAGHLGHDFHRNSEAVIGLQYWYVTEDGLNVVEKDRAHVTIDDEIGVGFLVKCNYNRLLQTGYKYKLDTSRPLGDDYVHVYLGNHDAEDIANPPAVREKTITYTGGQTGNIKAKPKPSTTSTEITKKSKPTKTVKHKTPQLLPLLDCASTSDSKSSSHTSGVPSITSTCTSIPKPHTEPDIVLIDSEESSLDSLPSIKLTCSSTHINKDYVFQNNTQDSVTGSAVSTSCLLERISKTSGKSFQPFNSAISIESQDSQNSVLSTNSQSSQNSMQSLTSISSIESQSLPVPDFVLRPGQFDIVLCVDNAEFYGASKGSSKTLLPDLIKNGIDCDLRKLHVGDILWIARQKLRHQPGQLAPPKGRELVLNYIIERKRMDDLVGSCIDGRFKEQKFRLKKCGLQYPMYLIEDYGSMEHFSIPAASIKQAITNTQVIDGFQVKRTKDSKESVAFLTVFTRYLQSSFKDKTLYACSLESIKDTQLHTSIDDSEQRLAVFDEFNQSSVKTKALTVQEMFGKQLIQLHGMSAEKARAIIDRYPSPYSLLQAYDMCNSEREREAMLAGVKCGKAVRNLGQVQSKQICKLYTTKSSLT